MKKFKKTKAKPPKVTHTKQSVTTNELNQERLKKLLKKTKKK